MPTHLTRRGLASLAAAMALVVIAGACGESTSSSSTLSDQSPPSLALSKSGTDISYVNLNGAGSGREVFRYALPNIIAF